MSFILENMYPFLKVFGRFVPHCNQSSISDLGIRTTDHF